MAVSDSSSDKTASDPALGRTDLSSAFYGFAWGTPSKSLLSIVMLLQQKNPRKSKFQKRPDGFGHLERQRKTYF